jgi:chromosome segregation ATPase
MAEISTDASELASLGQNLRDAEVAFMEADRRYREARAEQTAALNRLNDHQKKLDAFIEKLKAASPNAGDWKRSRDRGEVAL